MRITRAREDAEFLWIFMVGMRKSSCFGSHTYIQGGTRTDIETTLFPPGRVNFHQICVRSPPRPSRWWWPTDLLLKRKSPCTLQSLVRPPENRPNCLPVHTTDRFFSRQFFVNVGEMNFVTFVVVVVLMVAVARVSSTEVESCKKG